MRKILVIEDSEALLNDIVEMLTLEGFETVRASNGREGIDMVHRHFPDLIVCDVRMPVMDGYGVLDNLRSDPVTANIPFIFLTARTGRTEMREGMRLGADDYLTKPFTAEELINSVHARLNRNDLMQDEAKRRMTQLRKSIVLALPHELRTPLNAVLGFSEIIMADNGSLSKEQIDDMATHINEAALRLYRLVENYVIYANLEIMHADDEHAEAMRRGRTQYPVVVVAQQAEEKARQYHREDDLHLDMPSLYTPLAVEGDNFARVVTELLDNAFKFSKPGSPVAVSLADMGDAMSITIRDEGIGMKPEDIRSIGAYMQFQRAFLEQQGVGLGLVIAKRITELHNGTFDIDSELGQYTRVTLTLPFVHEKHTNGTGVQS